MSTEPKEKQPCRCGCGAIPQGRRTSFCSDECVHRFKLANWQAYWRAELFKRDRGVCARCGLDCHALKLEFLRLKRLAYRAEATLVALHPGLHYRQDYWQADHILARCLGGLNTLENGMTLCLPCHKLKTKADRMALKEKKALTSITHPDKNTP